MEPGNKLKVGDRVRILPPAINWTVHNSGFYKVHGTQDHTPEALAELAIWAYAWVKDRPLYGTVTGFGDWEQTGPKNKLRNVRVEFGNIVGKSFSFFAESNLRKVKTC